MTAARLKLGAQALAVGLVALLLALLVWKLAKGTGKEAAIGKSAPNFTLSRDRRAGYAAAGLAAREGRRAQLLGLLVLPVQAGGARAGGGREALAGHAWSCWAST